MARTAYYLSEILTADGSHVTVDNYSGAGYEGYKAADVSLTTYWRTDTSDCPHWWKYNFGAGNEKIITCVRITPFYDANGGGLKDFEIYGSNDDSNYTLLHSAQHDSSATRVAYSFVNTTAYRYYKIIFTTAWRSSSYNRIYLAEIELMAQAYDYGIDEYTKLLCHFNGPDAVTTASFIDESGQANVMTPSSVTPTLTEYKFGLRGGDFAGSSSVMSTPRNANITNLGTSPFTVDCWLKFDSIGDNYCLCAPWDDGGSNRWWVLCQGPNNSIKTTCVKGGVTICDGKTPNSSVTTGVWYHVAFVRNGADHDIYINGVKQTITWTVQPNINTDYGNVNVSVFRIGGQHYGTWGYNGYMDEFRWSTGIARWTANFDVPTEAYETDEYTKLLLHFENPIIDSSLSSKYITTMGTGQLDNAQTKFGTTSYLINASGNYATEADSADWDWGSGDFSVDWWCRINGVTGANVSFARTTNGGSYMYFQITNNAFRFADYNGGYTLNWNFTVPISDNVWYHMAVCRSGNTMYFFLDGFLYATLDVTGITLNDRAVGLDIGSMTQNGSYYLRGWIDEFRVSKGIARWTRGFTPPTTAYDIPAETKTSTIDSDGKIVTRSDEDIDSDSKIVTRSVEDIDSDATIKVEGVEQTINAEGKVVTREDEDIDSDAKIVHREYIDSDANIKIVGLETTIDSDGKVVTRSDEDVDSDAKIVLRQEQTIDSDARIQIAGIEETIDSDAHVVLGATILSSAKVVTRHETFIDSDGKVVTRETPTIDSDAKIIWRKTVTVDSDAAIKIVGIEGEIDSDAKVVYRESENIESNADIKVAGIALTINSDAYITHRAYISSTATIFYSKSFYTSMRLQKDVTKDFYEQIVVTQDVPTDPTGVTATDLKTGDSLKLAWNGDNYGWNVYKDVGSVWVKQNDTIITDNYYIVGDLTADVTYTFKIVGVNGIGDESTGVTKTGAPTFDITRYTKPIYHIYISGAERTDAILNQIELVYGPSFSTADFYIPKKYSTPGLPTASGQSVYITVNGHTVFTGYLVRKEDVLNAGSIRVNYHCINTLWDWTKNTIDKNYNEREGQHISSITINSILAQSGCPANLPNATLYGQVTVADMTKLELMANMLGYAGNYKIYTSPGGSLSYYKMGNPVSRRTYTVGRNILEYNLSTDITDKVDQVTVRSDYSQVTTYRQQMGWAQKVWGEENAVGDRSKLNFNIRVDSDGNLYIGPYYLYGKNISDVQVEALINDKPTGTEFLDIEVLPSHVGLEKWPDGSTDGKFPVTKYEEFTPEWRSISANVEYSHYGSYAKVTISPIPVRYMANVQKLEATLKAMDPDTKEIVETVTEVQLMMDPIEYLSAVRFIYTYQGNRYSHTIGAGTVKRTLHDSIQPYSIHTPYEWNGNTTDVATYLAARAQAEYDKLNKDTVGGSLTILGDETLDLRTAVNGYEVTRIIHDFSNGFRTRIDLTNERFFHGQAIQVQRETQRNRFVIKYESSKTVELNYDLGRIKNLVGFKTGPNTVKNPKSGIGHYSD